MITYSVHWRKTSAHPHPSVLIFLCNWYVLILEWVCILEALSGLCSPGFHLQPCHHLARLQENGGRGAVGSVDPLHGQSCWALTCFNLQRSRASLPCAQAHRSVGQVKGESAGTWEQKGCPLSPLEAIHHVASFCSCIGQLPPCRIFSFSCLSQEHLIAVFSKLFPLKSRMHVLNAVRPVPFWTLLKFSYCGGWRNAN